MANAIRSTVASSTAVLFAVALLLRAEPALKSEDGYVSTEGNTWTIGTALVEKQIAFKDGRLSLVSFRNKSSSRQYQDHGPGPAEIRFSLNGQDVSAPSWRWQLGDSHAKQLSQGELQLDIEVHGHGVGATKHYVIYPKTAVIREWLTIRNQSDVAVTIDNLCFLCSRVLGPDVNNLQLYYLTGGGNYNGSQLLKMERVSSAYTRTFDSYQAIQKESYSGYLPLVFLRNPGTNDGLAIGWDYLGHWRLQLGAEEGNPLNVALQVAGYEKQLQAGEQIETPKAFTAAFSGGIDELGNQLLDWQYRYLWEFTSPEYFAKTRWAVDWPSPWVGDGGSPSADNWGRRLALDLRYIDLLRETGTDILWDDAGWYDKWGSWNGPDWRRTTDYLQKYGMKWVLWYPTFLATPQSKVAQQHPDWIIPGHDAFEQSIKATADWQKKLLDGNVSDWGDFQWRYDIAPAVSANDTTYLDSDQNFRNLLERFKADHPHSGVDACYGGGRWISYDIARLAESGEYTDGGVGPYSGYYTSLLVPPDKLHNVSDFDHTYYSAASDHVHLGMNPTWYRDPGDGPDVEAVRKDWDTFHYLVSQSVLGRWSHVFRPPVKNDDPIWYFQRMNRDGSKGVIIAKHARRGPAYFIVSKPLNLSAGSHDQYRGGPAQMNAVVTSGDAALDTGVYQDPVDGAYRFYGVSGEAFGPLNFKYQADSKEQSFVTNVVKLGAKRPVENHLFGMAIQIDRPLTITDLGQFDAANNKGTYTLSIVRAADGALMGSAELDMSRSAVDSNGFKYARLLHPIPLEAPPAPVTIFPRGLLPERRYEVHAARSGFKLIKTGAELMAQGITFEKILPGELIFLNLPLYPGSGEDKVPPEPPSQVTKRRGSNLGVQGIEIKWSPGRDDNWIAFYEVFKNGKLIGKTAKGTFFFDHSENARGDVGANFQVRTVDGDGNRSPFATASAIGNDPETYEALGDFGPTQGANRWTYEEALENGSYAGLAWDNGGYEGRWTGSGLARIGRIWMQASADYDISRTFTLPASGIVTASGTIRKDPNTENGAPAFVRILQNDKQIWPAQGWAEINPAYDHPTEYRIANIRTSAGDKIRFLLKHNGQNRPDPVLWDPVVVLHGDAGSSAASGAIR